MNIGDPSQETPANAAIMLGQSLRRARLLRNWTQSDLAHRANISERCLKKLEAGSNVTLATWLAVAQELGYAKDIMSVCSQTKLTSIKQVESLELGTCKARQRARSRTEKTKSPR